MARTKTSSSIDISGPFFARDPRKTFRQNIRELTASIAKIAEADVRQQMQAGEADRKPIGHGVKPDRVADHVKGRVSSLAGKKWAVTAVVSAQNQGFTKAQGTALMAAAASVEKRTHAFRRTTTAMRKGRGVNLDELLKGIG
jgi:hypothetical protein